MELNIVELNASEVTKLSGNYEAKMLNRLKEEFSDDQQHLFVTSFYCYLNYNQSKDFVIDLDDVWKWMGFNQKTNALRVLEKNFVNEKDFKSFALPIGKANYQKKDDNLFMFQHKQKDGSGGHNKQKYMMTVKTFKKMCLKAGTKKADEIHDYFLKMEEILQKVIQEESQELKLQLEMKEHEIEMKEQEMEDEKTKQTKEKEQLLEKTLVSQFPVNTQCIYYGKIDNKTGGKEGSNMYQESLIKFGQTNDLGERIKSHKRSFDNFVLLAAFKVKNKIEIENAIKRHHTLKKRLRSLTMLPNANFKEETYRELLALD
jgi:phage anti-repressor protein